MNRANIVKFMLQLTSIIGIYIFFTGWAYLYNYFISFGLSLSTLNLPFYYFLIYSFNALIDFKVLFIVILMVFYFFITSGKPIKYSKTLIVADVIVLIAMFPLLYLFAGDIGANDAGMRKKVSDKTLPNIQIVLKKDYAMSNAFIASDKKCSANEQRLLLFNNNIFYVFYPSEGIQNGCDSVYLIPKESAVIAKINPPKSKISIKN